MLHDHSGWYDTFKAAGIARRAAMVLNTRSLAHHSVTLTVHPPPSSTHVPATKLPVLKPKLRLPTPTPDPYRPGLCEDDEDLYSARLALAESMGMSLPALAPAPGPDSESPSPFLVHLTGSARAEGYYKISQCGEVRIRCAVCDTWYCH